MQAEEAAASGDANKAAMLDQQVSELGGRAAYQAASELTTSKHRVSKWVFSVLTELGQRPSKGQPPLPLLEVRPAALLQPAESAKGQLPAPASGCAASVDSLPCCCSCSHCTLPATHCAVPAGRIIVLHLFVRRREAQLHHTSSKKLQHGDGSRRS